MKKLDEYKVGEEVEVLYYIPQTNYKESEWRLGTVTRTNIIYPNVGERHRPYPVVHVDFVRAYYNNGEFVNKPSNTMVIYNEEIRPYEQIKQTKEDGK